jgi:hypothetical protein
MPAVIRSQTRYSPVQRFRAWSERTLIDAAQEDLHRAYPGVSIRPRHGGVVRRVVRVGFRTGFRVTPRPIRTRVMAVLLIGKGQDWDPA